MQIKVVETGKVGSQKKVDSFLKKLFENIGENDEILFLENEIVVYGEFIYAEISTIGLLCVTEHLGSAIRVAGKDVILNTAEKIDDLNVFFVRLLKQGKEQKEEIKRFSFSETSSLLESYKASSKMMKLSLNPFQVISFQNTGEVIDANKGSFIAEKESEQDEYSVIGHVLSVIPKFLGKMTGGSSFLAEYNMRIHEDSRSIEFKFIHKLDASSELNYRVVFKNFKELVALGS